MSAHRAGGRRVGLHARKWASPLVAAAVLLATTLQPVAAAKPPPNTVIDSGPAALTNSTTATFTFHSTASGATFACGFEGSALTACTSPKSYPGLAAGSHSFSVTSSANGVTDPTPATSSWIIDLTRPTAPTSLAATTPSATSVALTWQAGTDNIGVTNNVILRDGAILATVGAVTAYTDATVAASSTHTYAVEARDGAGNQSPSSNSVIATTPAAPALDTSITAAPAALTNSTSASLSFTATVQGATFTCKVDTGRAGSCTSPKLYTGLGSGSHFFSVYATANGVNDTTPATAAWTVDTTPPSAPTNLAASASATAVGLSWTASSDNTGVIGYDVLRGGSVVASVSAVTTYTDTTISVGQTYIYTVRAKDGAGNLSASSSSVSATPRASFDPHLTRAPYLTDLVGLHVAINFATDQSGTTGGIQYGTVGTGGSCTASTVIAATRTTVLVGTVSEYQWKGDLTVPTAGTYCYRVFLGSTDLLGANPSPTFTTQVQFGSTETFSFDVFGDWGQVDASGQNAGQASLMAQIAASGARFAISTGDNGYPNGSQINYGDLQQSGASTSAIFGPSFWTIPGSSIPLFTAVGNHGVSGVQHTDITTWTQASAVSTSSGRYQNDVYCCVNGSSPSNYGSEWYAFSAGNVRFYILDSAWGDTNGGNATPYANDALAHFAPGTPEYVWLLNDLQAHPTQLKFAVSHFPFYADNPSQPGDTYLQGASNLEGILGQHGVQLVFNGHAHIYERNRASASGMPITYVTGGGGATLEPIGPCNTYDLYGIGWSPTTLTGTACGSGRAPMSAGQVFHFLKVTVSGTTVTVAPTDSTGHTFDVQTYTFKVPTDTYIDSAPPAGTTSTSATFTFHASGNPATYSCQLDAGTSTACTSPVTYTGLAQGVHTFRVAARVNKSTDPTPALATWTVDTTPPSTPTGLAATAPSPFTVNLAWNAATDNTGVTGYEIYRDGSPYQSIGPVTSYTDDVLGGATHQYAIDASDVAGNHSPQSGPVSVTTPPPPVPVFADGFESGDSSAWPTHAGLTIESGTVHSGANAAEGNTTTGATYVKKTLATTYSDAYARVWFDVVAQPSQVNLLRLRDASGNSLGYVYIETTGQLGYHNDALGSNSLSDQSPSPGWHALELHLKVDPSAGMVEIWLDNRLVADLSSSGMNTGSAPVGAIQIGEVQSGLTYDVIFDDAAFGSSRLGPAADGTPPTVPANLSATASSAFSVALGWDASTDDVGVTGYDLWRDGHLLASLDGSTLTYTDTTVLAGTSYSYAVRARDLAGNVSAFSTAVPVTTPAAAPAIFSDGFESGDFSAWTTHAGLTVESTTVHNGTSAAEGSTTTGNTNAKETLPTTYSDAYARVWFDVVSQSSQLTLLRLRDAPTGNGGYLYLTSTGKLAFRSDALPAGTVSGVSPAPGWHALELHLNITSGSVETWLDGAAVSALTLSGVNLGSAPMGVLQIGETATSGSWDVIFDDAAFGSSRLGPAADAP